MEKVSVVIPVFGREDVFDSVAMLRAQEYAGALRLIIVDNGNEPVLAARIAALVAPDCQVIRFETNRGGSAAYIAGMECALKEHGEAQLVWLLDDDARANERTLPQLVSTFRELATRDERVASVGATVVSAEDELRIIECGARFSTLLGKAFGRLRGERLTAAADKVLRVDYSAACSLLVNKAAVWAVGFWEDVFIHFDDIEWGVRATKAGWHNYATTRATVVHAEFDPDKAGAWICYFDARNQFWLAAKFGALHVTLAYVKNAMKNLRARIFGYHRDRIAYRRLAWQDYRQGIRRTRAEVMRIVEEDR